jgi:hypothetical protein
MPIVPELKRRDQVKNNNKKLLKKNNTLLKTVGKLGASGLCL